MERRDEALGIASGWHHCSEAVHFPVELIMTAETQEVVVRQGRFRLWWWEETSSVLEDEVPKAVGDGRKVWRGRRRKGY